MDVTETLQSIREKALARRVDFADARAVERNYTSITRQDGRADKLSLWTSRGLCVRVLKDGAWGFGSMSEWLPDRAGGCLDAAIGMAQASKPGVSDPGMVARVEPSVGKWAGKCETDPRDVPVETKMQFLERHEKIAADHAGDKLANTIFSYTDIAQREVVCNTFGTLTDSESVRVRAFARVTARDGDLRETGSEQVGALAGYELAERTEPEEFSLKAARMAVSLLSSEEAPAGTFPVIFHPSVTGLFTHEALGHNAEADLIHSGMSIISGKLGERIGSDVVTIIDDGTLEGAWGSYGYDSEGTPAQRRVIIENGVLKGYLHSLETAARMDMPPNGSARADGYDNRPIVRMSNTFIQPGTMTLEELVKGIDLGVLLEGFQYGHVMSERGQFTCHVSKGTMIRNGELAEMVRDVSVSGLTLDTLMNIDAVSKDFELRMPGTCGKNGQGMFTDGGGPYVRVREMVVGGRRQV